MLIQSQETLRFFLNYKVTEASNFIEQTPDPSDKPEKLPEHYIFIPFQVNTDSQITRFSPWIKDMYDLVTKRTKFLWQWG